MTLHKVIELNGNNFFKIIYFIVLKIHWKFEGLKIDYDKINNFFVRE